MIYIENSQERCSILPFVWTSHKPPTANRSTPAIKQFTFMLKNIVKIAEPLLYVVYVFVMFEISLKTDFFKYQEQRRTL